MTRNSYRGPLKFFLRSPPLYWTIRRIGVALVYVMIATSGWSADSNSPSAPTAPSDPAAEALENRLLRLEAKNRQLEKRLRELAGADQSDGVPNPPARLPDADDDEEAGEVPESAAAPGPTEAEEEPSDIATDEALVDEQGQPIPGPFAKGFIWETKDGEVQLQIHNETQFDIRAYEQPHSEPTNQVGYYIPRARLYFNGHLTKPIEYTVSINKGLGAFDLLDAYLNFNYDPRFQFRVGRYRTPFTYEWYALANQFMMTPERSVWEINYGYNRNSAAMLHGEIFKESAEYAIAIASGPRNSYFDTNAAKDLVSYLNVRPFMNSSQFPALKFFNVGASTAYGIQNQPPIPRDFRTSGNAADNAGTLEAVPTFLRLFDNVVERGSRWLNSLHTAYYYKQLSVIAAWDYGYHTYCFDDQPGKFRLPTWGYNVGFGYFLTGEEIERRNVVTPKRPFDLRKGKRGCGAWEIQSRYSDFAVSSSVFTDGLADPAIWTNSARVVDVGVNWYLNQYVKLYFDWQHSEFGSPVPYRPGAFQRNSDLFWTRFQIYF